MVTQHRAVRWRLPGSSWRSRVGWGLFGCALSVVCVALPVWAVTAGNLNEVAGWANILALPITALGLVLVLADRARVRTPAETVDAGRRPWMAPPLDRMVERPELGDRLLAALMAPTPAEVGLTTGLQGAGGFGKTRLATWVCHQPEIDQRYPGGLLWVTVGQEVRGADLAERINDLAFVLSGQRPAISDPDAAFDPARPADRNQAVAATIAASLALLDPADRQRYLDLAIFPEDVDIPLDVLRLLWPGCRVNALCEELVGLGLIADHRLDPPGPRLAARRDARPTCRLAVAPQSRRRYTGS